MKKLISSVIVLAILASVFIYTTCTASDITVTVDGVPVVFDVEPKIIDGRTLVPLRKIFEEIGALVKWDGDTQTVSARKNSKTVTLTIGSEEMTIDKGNTDENGNPTTETVILDVSAQIIDGRTLVPVRAISEAFSMTVDWDSNASAVSIGLGSDENDEWKNNTKEIKLSELKDSQLVITEGGDYTLSGTLVGSITVNSEDKVKLRLADAAITAESEPCIYIENADKAYITIENGTKNSLISKKCESGAIYSKDNLEIKGKGTLDIVSEAGHGIKASDNLIIESGNISITAQRDGMHINDTFKMKDGNVNIEAVGDGINSESIVNISGGAINVKTTLEPTNAPALNNTTDKNQGFGNPFEGISAEFESSAKGIKADWMMAVSGGSINVSSTDHAIHCSSDIEITGGDFTLSSKYGKGISGHGNVTVDGKDTVINVQKSTEGLESKNVMTVNDGTIRIIASDDGINGGGTQGMGFGAPDGGNGGDRKGNRQPLQEGLDFGDKEPPENMEFGIRQPLQEDMDFGDKKPPEDMDFGNRQPSKGMNFEDRQPQGGMDGKSLKDVLIINGGDIEVNAGDDCLDANGNMVINGGIIKASEPRGSVTGFTAVFDADGTTTINKDAVVIAAAGSGTAPNLDISQRTVTLYADAAHNAGDAIILKDSAGKTLAEYSPTGSYRVVWLALPSLTAGSNYTITAGDEDHSFRAEENTVIGTSESGFGSFKGGFGGNRGQKRMQ